VKKKSLLGVAAVVLIAGGAWYALLDCSGLALAGSGTCRAACKAAYGRCYKATGGNRQLCDAKYRKCLESCLKSYKIN